MNQELRDGIAAWHAAQAVRVALAERGMSQVNLARRIGTHASTLSRTLSEGQLIDSRSLWPKILEELELEVVIRVKG